MNFVMFKKYNLTGSQEDEYFVIVHSLMIEKGLQMCFSDFLTVVQRTGHNGIGMGQELCVYVVVEA